MTMRQAANAGCKFHIPFTLQGGDVGLFQKLHEVYSVAELVRMGMQHVDLVNKLRRLAYNETVCTRCAGLGEEPTGRDCQVCEQCNGTGELDEQ